MTEIQNKSGQVTTGHDGSEQFRKGVIRTGQNRSGHAMTNQGTPGQVRAGQNQSEQTVRAGIRTNSIMQRYYYT